MLLPMVAGWVYRRFSWIDDNTLLIVERDNQQRDAAQVKRLYRVSVAASNRSPPACNFQCWPRRWSAICLWKTITGWRRSKVLH